MDGSNRRRREQGRRLGELPLKLGLFAYYNAIRPNADEDPWQLQVTLTFIFSEQRVWPGLRKEP